MDLYSNYNKTIDSSASGPYDPSTKAGQGANVGYNVGQAYNNYDRSIFHKSYQYSTQNCNGSLSDDSLMGFSSEMVRSMDSTGDGKVTADDKYWQATADTGNCIMDKNKSLSSKFDESLLTDGKVDPQKLFNNYDVNKNGEFDAADEAAITKLKDSYADEEKFKQRGYTGTANDGIITPDEEGLGFAAMFKTSASDKLGKIYKENNLGEKYNLFQQNGTTGESGTLTDTSSISDSQYANAGVAEAYMASQMTNPDNVIYAVQKEDGTWSKDYTNAYSQGIVNSLDSTGDGKVTADDDAFKCGLTGAGENAQEVFSKFDVNSNGSYDAKDNAALALLQDNTSKFYSNVSGVAGDGMNTSDEIKAGIDFVKYNPYGTEKLKEAYDRIAGAVTDISNSECE